MARQVEQDTREAILDVAERLVQQRGFNAFSYAHVAAELGVTTAALHYHFPSKADLGEALVARYSTRFLGALRAIDGSSATACARLRAYADLYIEVAKDERMCLCGMLAAEQETLADPVRRRLLAFFDENLTWLTRLFEAGRADGTLAGTGSPAAAAEVVLGALEGAMLVARAYGDAGRLEAVAARLLADCARGARPS